MNIVKTISDAEYKAFQDKIKPFQTAIDLVTLAQACKMFDWAVNSRHGKFTSAAFEKEDQARIQKILEKHGIPGEWSEDTFWKAVRFELPTAEAEKHPLLVSMRAIKGAGGITHPQNLVLQLANYMPQSQK